MGTTVHVAVIGGMPKKLKRHLQVCALLADDCAVTSRARTRDIVRDQNGFTMIELLVGMVLLAIVTAVAFRPVMDAFRGSSKAQTQAITEQQIQDAQEALSADLRIALAGERTPDNLPGVPELSRALSGRPGTAMSARTGYPLWDVYDVWYAGNDGTKSWLVVRADVSAQPGVECVQYMATLSPQVSLTRTVSIWNFVNNNAQASCGGAQIDTKEIISPSQTAVGVDVTSLFTLHELKNDAACTPTDIPLTQGVELNPFTAGGEELNRVIAVSIDLYSSRERGGQFSSSSRSVRISLRPREDATYRRALGCKA